MQWITWMTCAWCMKTKRNETNWNKTKRCKTKQSETKQNKKHIWNTTYMTPEWGETFFLLLRGCGYWRKYRWNQLLLDQQSQMWPVGGQKPIFVETENEKKKKRKRIGTIWIFLPVGNLTLKRTLVWRFFFYDWKMKRVMLERVMARNSSMSTIGETSTGMKE